MIPDFLDNGYLPEGIYEATFEEVAERFGKSKVRKKLLLGMREMVALCKQLGCDIYYLDGSFISNKISPSDYDACWDTTCSDRELVMNKVLYSILNSDSETQKNEFKGEIYPSFIKAPIVPNLTILDYFQTCKDADDSNMKKGIIKINL